MQTMPVDGLPPLFSADMIADLQAHDELKGIVTL
jgi:hypothetical protein